MIAYFADKDTIFSGNGKGFHKIYIRGTLPHSLIREETARSVYSSTPGRPTVRL